MPTLQEHYYNSLLAHVRSDRYPSSQLMNRLEAMVATSDQVADYLEVLMEKVDSSRYPSSQILDRIERVMLAVASACRPPRFARRARPRPSARSVWVRAAGGRYRL